MRPRYGTVVRSTERAVIDSLVASGLDWLMLDGEHASVGPAEITAMVSAVGGRVPCYARVRELDAAAVGHALNAGADGVIIPNVDSVRQAEESVRCVPGLCWPQARIVVQAESGEAVRNIEGIVAVRGIEWVLIGPNDLTRSLGITGQFDHPAYAKAVSVIESACRAANIPVGIFGMTPDRVRPFADRGFEWLLTGIDRPA